MGERATRTYGTTSTMVAERFATGTANLICQDCHQCLWLRYSLVLPLEHSSQTCMFYSSICVPWMLNGDYYWSFSRAASNNDKLPEDVLLEIFDVYRQLYELQSGYEKLWNSRWFRLAHVCQSWRRVVLFSSSRLRLH